MLGEGNEGLSGWVIAGVASIIATLSSTVAFLFKLRESQIQKQIKGLQDDYDEVKEECKILQAKSDECIQDREDLRVEIARIKERLPKE